MLAYGTAGAGRRLGGVCDSGGCLRGRRRRCLASRDGGLVGGGVRGGRRWGTPEPCQLEYKAYELELAETSRVLLYRTDRGQGPLSVLYNTEGGGGAWPEATEGEAHQRLFIINHVRHGAGTLRRLMSFSNSQYSLWPRGGWRRQGTDRRTHLAGPTTTWCASPWEAECLILALAVSLDGRSGHGGLDEQRLGGGLGGGGGEDEHGDGAESESLLRADRASWRAVTSRATMSREVTSPASRRSQRRRQERRVALQHHAARRAESCAS